MPRRKGNREYDFKAAAELDEAIRAANEAGDAKRARRLAKRLRKLGAPPEAPSGATGPAKAPEPEPEDPGAAPRVHFAVAPESTQSIMGFESLHRDGIMRLPEGAYSIALELDDVNYTGTRPEEQEDKRYLWGSWLDSVDTRCRVKLYTSSRRISSKTFSERLAFGHDESDPMGNPFREELDAWCRSKLASTTRAMERHRIAVITVEADGYEAAAAPLAAEATKLVKCMQQLDSGARIMSGQERLDSLRRITHPDSEPGTVPFSLISSGIGLSSLDLAAPYSVTRVNERPGDSRLIVGGRYVQTFTLLLDGYGNRIRDDFVTDLVSVPYDIDVSLDIRPWEPDVAQAAVDRQLFNVQTENNTYMNNNSRPERGYFVDHDSLPIRMQEAEREALAAREDLYGERQMHCFGVTMCVMCSGRDADELDLAVKEVKRLFKKHKKSVPDSWRSLRTQALTTMLPTGACRLPYERSIMTDPLSHMIPFASVELKDDHGLIMGVNADTNDFVVYDPVKYEHANSFLVALPGSGKSTNMKITRVVQNRLRHPDADQIWIDPEGEGTALVRQLGGVTVEVSETAATRINPLDISAGYGSDGPEAVGNPVPSKVSFIQALFHVMAPEITDIQRNVLDSVAAACYARWRDTKRASDVPTLQDVYDALLAEEGPNAADAHRLASLVRRYVEGTLSVFNGRTNIDLDSHLVSFDLSRLSQELKPLALLVLLDHVWVRVTRNRRAGRRTWLYIDEFQLLIDDPYALEQFDRFFTRGRKWDLYEVAATQNVSRLLDNERALYMLQNSPFLTLLGQTQNSASMFGHLLNLSDDQVRTLMRSTPGQGLYVMRNKVIRFDFTIDRETCPTLYDAITTRPEDIKRMRRERLASLAPSDPARAEELERLMARVEALEAENDRLRAESSLHPVAAPEPSDDLDETDSDGDDLAIVQAVEAEVQRVFSRRSENHFNDLEAALATHGVAIDFTEDNRDLKFSRSGRTVTGTQMAMSLSRLMAMSKAAGRPVNAEDPSDAVADEDGAATTMAIPAAMLAGIADAGGALETTGTEGGPDGPEASEGPSAEAGADTGTGPDGESVSPAGKTRPVPDRAAVLARRAAERSRLARQAEDASAEAEASGADPAAEIRDREAARRADGAPLPGFVPRRRRAAGTTLSAARALADAAGETMDESFGPLNGDLVPDDWDADASDDGTGFVKTAG